MSATLDTNVVLRLVLRDIPEQYEVVRAMVTARGARYRVTDAVINETVYALIHHYGLSRPQVAEIVRSIIWDPAIEANKDLIESAITLFIEHQALSYTDCYLAEEARISGNVPLFTFDHKLATQHTVAKEPKR